MSVYDKIVGTVSNLFQLGRRGPQLKNNSGVVEHRNAADSAFVIARGADPVGASDFVTKNYGDTNYTGGGGSAHVGYIIIDFGAHPGGTDATVAVTGQSTILVTSIVEAWLYPFAATADHSVDEHRIEQMDVVANGDSIIAGTGFTIFGSSRNTKIYGQWYVAWYWANP